MREAVKQKVHCSGSIRFLREKAALRNLGGLGVWLAGPGRRSPGWERYSSGAGHHPPELHLPTEDGVGPTAGVQSQEVSIPAEAEQGRGRRRMRRAGLPGASVSAPLFPNHPPGLEDQCEVLLTEEHPRGVPADFLHVHVHHH